MDHLTDCLLKLFFNKTVRHFQVCSKNYWMIFILLFFFTAQKIKRFHCLSLVGCFLDNWITDNRGGHSHDKRRWLTVRRSAIEVDDEVDVDGKDVGDGR